MSAVAAELMLDIRDGVAWITFNRPQKANALTSAMLQQLEQTLNNCAADDAIRAAVLTGAGTRAFSAGADLAAPADNQADIPERRRLQFAAALRALVDFGKPAIAAVNGAACGYGMMLAMVCDRVVAAKTARFSLPEINKGTPTLTGITLLTERFGAAIAADLVLSGRFIGADEAHSRGMVQQVVDDNELLEQVQKTALALSANSARAYAQNKQWLNRSLRDALAAATLASAQLH